MKLASKDRNGFLETQSFRIWRMYKRVRQRVRYQPGMDKTVVYIVGCQRSGTSMLSHLFRRDPDAVTYDEVSPLSDRDLKQGLRWNPLPEVRSRITADRAPLVVTKPLVESQNLPDLMDLFPDTRAIWMYRHYADVASSNVKFFADGNSHDDLRPILDAAVTDWRAEHLDPGIAAEIGEHFSAQTSAWDAAALFWYARNSLYFSRGYENPAAVRTCRYSDLVTRPAEVMAQAYLFLGRPWPGDRIIRDVFADSWGRGRDIPLSPPVRELCEDLMVKLDATTRLGTTTD